MKLYSIENLSAPLGWNIQVVEQTDSTNDHLFRLAEQDKADKLVLLARTQTNGKGSRARHFFSFEGGIYLSILLRNISPKTLPLLTPMAAVALYEALLPHTDKSLAIKWVNDIYLEGKKLCGILTENRFLEGKAVTVVGVGINLVTPKAFPSDFLHPATALISEPDSAVAESVINSFLSRFISIMEGGVIPPLYKEKCCTLGKEVTLRQGDSLLVGEAIDIEQNGALVVRLNDGSCRTFSSGEVTSQI